MSKFGIVENHFEYKGHDCICVFTVLGYRCGYVSVDRDYRGYDIKDTLYIGFDCGHICDGRDCVTALKYGLITEKRYNELIETEILSPTFLQPVRSLEYVENECKKIVDQLEVKDKAV